MKEDALMTARRYLSLSLQRIGSVGQKKIAEQLEPVSYTHLTLPTTPYV